ncbi:MAG: AIR synthase related protein, partial [Planctomycetota bacterium]
MESELIAHLRKRLPAHPLLRLGIGDDAAVLRMAEVGECVLTVDLLTDHVDFELTKVDPRRVGRKALAVNLSDLAAMASEPLAAV